MNKPVLAAMGCVLSWSLASTQAEASGYALAAFGGELGTVVTANPTAIYYNPGALGFSGTQLMMDAMLVMRASWWTHPQQPSDIPEPAGFEGANYGSAHSFLVAGGPQFAASLQLGKHLVLGGGAYIPFGGGTIQFDRNERFASSAYPGAADGVTRWHAHEAGMSAFYATTGAAVRFGAISVGATFNLIWSSLTVKRAQGSAGNNDLTREQRVSVDAKEIVGSFGVGALWEVFPEQLWLGASYQAQPGLGEFTMEGTSTLDATVNITDPTRSQDVAVHQAMPDIIRSGMRIRPSPHVELRWTASFTRWSVNQTQCIGVPSLPCTVLSDGSAAPGSGAIKVLRRHWEDTIGIHGGASYWPTTNIELFGGAAYEPAAVPDATLDPLTADAKNISTALGLRLRVFDNILIALSYNHKQFLPRNNTGKSDLSNPDLSPITRSADGGGQYESWFSTIHLNLAATL